MKDNCFFKLFFTALVFGFFLLSGGCGPEVNKAAKVPLPAVGEQLPAMTLTTPKEASTRAYLNLPDGTGPTIGLENIESEILLIEIFSMYCPYCQHEAPTVNELYNLIQKDEKLAARIKLIGIGIGNSTFEVGIFHDKYEVEFPLFADENYVIYKNIGPVRTPFFIAVHNRGAKKNQIFYAKLGRFGDPEDFLEVLLDLAGR